MNSWIDTAATWDWRAWSVLAVLAVVVGRFVWRWGSALAFRHLLLGAALRRYGWQADLPGGDGGRAAFREQEQRRRRQAWALLRQGRRGLGEGYRTGVFGRTQGGTWHPTLIVTGGWRGRRFTATELRRIELSSEGSRRNVRRRAFVRVDAAVPVTDVRVGLLTGGLRRGSPPPEVAALVRAHRWRFRGFTSDGTGLSVELGPRLRRGRLIAALDYLSDVAERLR